MANKLTCLYNTWVKRFSQELENTPIDQPEDFSFETRMMLVFEEASDRAKRGMWCPLPSELNNSLASPEILALNPDMFRQLYLDNISGTVEEAIAEALYIALMECANCAISLKTIDDGLYQTYQRNNNEAAGWLIAISHTFDKHHNSNVPTYGWSSYCVDCIASLAKTWDFDVLQYLKWYIDFTQWKSNK